MGIKEKIEKDFIKAYKNKDKSLDTLRMLKSAIKNAEINKKGDLTEDEIAKVLQKERKQREDSVREYEKGNRQDLVSKEKEEIEIINKYLPKQLEDKEIIAIVQKAIKELNAHSVQDIGKVMGRIMPELKGKADGAKVAEIVKKELNR